MPNTAHTYILIFSCQDKPGIVAAVAGFLADHGCNILESQQYGDAVTGRFFMRTAFAPVGKPQTLASLYAQFSSVADHFGMNWELHDTDRKARVVIAVSKSGHCLNHLLHRYANGKLPVEIPAVISNHPDLKQMVEWYDIPFYHLPVTPETKPAQEARILALMQEAQADVLVLARYMQILSPALSEKLKGRAINIHHSFLPSFKGAEPYKQAYERGVKIIGATAHYVTGDLDEGPIIEQEVTRVDHAHTPEQLKLLGQDIESQVLYRALTCHIEHRVLINGLKTVVFR